MVIDAIEDADADADDFGTEALVMLDASKRLLENLEDQWEEDVEFGGSGVGRRVARAQRLFRALAEVSHATGSRMLGSVLRTFFLGWLHELVEEDEVALAGWCWGIARAWIKPREKEECLRALVAWRPDVLAELSGRASAGRLPLALHALSNAAGTMRDWPRRRRAAGRRWWDDENDRRIRRMVEDSDYHGHGAADRDKRRMVSLRLGDDTDYYRRPAGRARPIRSSRSLDSVLRRSRSPRLRRDSDAARRLRYIEDLDQDDGYLSTGQRMLEDRPSLARAQLLRGQAKQILVRQLLDE